MLNLALSAGNYYLYMLLKNVLDEGNAKYDNYKKHDMLPKFLEACLDKITLQTIQKGSLRRSPIS